MAKNDILKNSLRNAQQLWNLNVHLGTLGRYSRPLTNNSVDTAGT